MYGVTIVEDYFVLIYFIIK